MSFRNTRFRASRERAYPCWSVESYIVKAGTIILVCNTVVQIMQSFNWQFQLVEEGAESTSILASIAHPFAILFIPLGFGVWQLAAAAITGFIAKENVVGTLAVVYGVTNLIDADALELVGSGNEVASVMALTKVAALAYLMFNLYTPPCFAALGAMNSEMKSGKWLFGGICLQLGTGYTVAFLVYQIGTHYHRISRNRICSWTDRCGDIRSDCVMENPQIRQRICGRIQLTCGFRR